MRKILLAGAAVAAVLGWSGVANADIIDLGTTSSITVTDISGLGTLSFSPSPASDIKEVNNDSNQGTANEWGNIFTNQSTTGVAAGITTTFGLSPSVTLTSNDSNDETNFSSPLTLTGLTPFNFVAIHNDHGELVFEYSTAQTSFSLSGTFSGVSGIDFYGASGGPFQVQGSVPEPSTWAMMLLGFLGVGFLAYRRHSRSGGQTFRVA